MHRAKGDRLVRARVLSVCDNALYCIWLGAALFEKVYIYYICADSPEPLLHVRICANSTEFSLLADAILKCRIILHWDRGIITLKFYLCYSIILSYGFRRTGFTKTRLLSS